MRYNLIKPFPYTAELWDVEFDAETGDIVSEQLLTNVRISMDTDTATTLRIDSQEPLRTRRILRNIRDRNGNLIYPSLDTVNGEAYYITAEVPVLGAVGYVEGYTSTAKKTMSA